MSPNRRKIAVGAAVAVVVAAAAWLLLSGDGAPEDVLSASGTVEATEAHLGFQAPGRIRELRAEEGDAVEAGDTLAELDRAGTRARREAAEAEVEAARAALRELETGARPQELEQARAAVRAAGERRDDARRDLERTRTLHEGGAASREALDKARTRLELATSELEQARERLSLLEDGPRPERIEAARARLRSARASLRSQDAALEDMVITAPFPGVVTVRHREPGESAPAGSAVFTLMDPADRWVRIYVREDRIGAVSLGQEAAITSDTYRDRDYGGRVSFIASEAEFTPRNVQTQEERVKLVYAVKVRITGDPARTLKPGMPADVEIRLEDGGDEGADAGGGDAE